jgi:acetyltransferase-like isoleucine patch superfamily enzyme
MRVLNELHVQDSSLQNRRRVMRFLKECVKELMYRPFGIAFGERSFILRPWTIHGSRHIRIGSHAITQYAGIAYQPRIEIGEDVYIGRHAYLTSIDRIAIGDGCVLSESVYITDEIHGNDPRAGLTMLQPLFSKGPVLIGPGCFLGLRAAIMPGVTLGAHCVVGANSTVTRSFPAYSMIGGSPARLLKCFSHTEGAWIAIEPRAESG